MSSGEHWEMMSAAVPSGFGSATTFRSERESSNRGLLTEFGVVHRLVLRCSVRSATCLDESMVRTGGLVVGGR
jgi:hypothetical protein